MFSDKLAKATKTCAQGTKTLLVQAAWNPQVSINTRRRRD